jgi:hypothetical protein
MQLVGTHEGGPKEVASAHPGSPSLADVGQPGGWTRRFQPKRPVWTMPVVVLDIDPEDQFQVTPADDQQPVEALGADGTDPPLRIGVRVRRPDRRHQHLGALSAEHVVEPATELCVSISNQEPYPPATLVQHQE